MRENEFLIARVRNLFSHELNTNQLILHSHSKMTDEKSKNVDKASKNKKLLSVIDKIVIVIAVSLGIATFFTTNLQIKPLLMLLGVFPATWLAARSIVLLKELKTESKSTKPFESCYNFNLWFQLIINSFAIVGNVAFSCYLMFHKKD